MARHFVLLGLLLMGLLLASAALVSSRRLRGIGVGDGSTDVDDDGGGGDWGVADAEWARGEADSTDDDHDDPAVASFFARMEHLEGQDVGPTVAAVSTAAAPPAAPAVSQQSQQQQGPATVLAPPVLDRRWIEYGNEDENPTFYFTGDAKPTWESVDGEVRLNGRPFHIKGISWFGAETDTR